MLLLLGFGPGDAGTGHLERVENRIELLAAEQFVAQDNLAHWRPLHDRFARDASRCFIAHVRVDGRDDTDTAVNVGAHALDIGGESLDQILAEYLEDVGHDADRLKQIENEYRLHHVELELTGLRSEADRVVVANNLESYLVHALRHHRVHLARHDARAWLSSRQIELVQAATRPGCHHP